MRLRSTAIAVLVTVLGVLSAVVAPAQADTKSIRDKVGDAPSGFDLTKVTASNDAAGLTVQARVRDLKGIGTQTFLAYTASGRDQPFYFAWSIRRGDGSVVTKLTRFGPFGPSTVKCGVSSRWRVKLDRVRIAIPRACLTEDRAVSVGVAIGAGNLDNDAPADFTRSFRVRVG